MTPDMHIFLVPIGLLTLVVGIIMIIYYSNESRDLKRRTEEAKAKNKPLEHAETTLLGGEATVGLTSSVQEKSKTDNHETDALGYLTPVFKHPLIPQLDTYYNIEYGRDLPVPKAKKKRGRPAKKKKTVKKTRKAKR